jgi:hypothetical protein
VPTPGTLFALIVTEAADEAPVGALLLGEPAVVLEDDEPHAATVAAAPSARPPASSQLLSAPRRCLALFSPIVLFISILLTILSAAFRQQIAFVFLWSTDSVAAEAMRASGSLPCAMIGGAGTGLRAYAADCFWVCRWCQM